MATDVFIFIGPPGAGKGTLASVCVEEHGWDQLSTGYLCRKHIAEGTEIGKSIDLIIKSGKLISDELVTEMVAEWLLEKQTSAQGIILDGFPRTVKQAEGFEKILQNSLRSINLHIVRLIVADSVVMERLSLRYVCSNKDCQAVYSAAPGSVNAPKEADVCDQCGASLIRRADDNKESILKRLEIYHQHEKALLDFYKSIGREIVEVNVEKPLAMVFQEFKKQVGI
jgi:adenylate kinase